MTPKMKFLRHLGNTITDQEKGNPSLFLTSTMKLENRGFRAMIYYDLRRGLTYHESHTHTHKTCVKLSGALPQENQQLASGFGSFELVEVILMMTIVVATCFCCHPRESRPSQRTDQRRRRNSLQDLQEILGIGMSALNEILHHQLGVHKRCARWVPHQLTKEQKVGSVQWCLTMLEKYNSECANSTGNIVSGDETWVYQFDPETITQSSVWLFPGDTPPLKFKRSRSITKQMVASYIAKTGHITTIPLEEGRTVTADSYVH